MIKKVGPFRNLSDLEPGMAEAVLDSIRKEKAEYAMRSSTG